MNKIAIVCAATFTALAALAVVDTVDPRTLTPEELARHQRKMEQKRKYVADNGGYVTRPVTGRVVRIVSAQKLVTRADLAQSMDVFSETLQLPVDWLDIETKETSPSKIAGLANKDGKIGAAVLLVEDPDLPALLVAPENFWAVINVTKLNADGPSHAQLARRAKQEFWRAACITLGAYTSMQQPCLMTMMQGNADLDANVCVIPQVEVLPKTKNGANKLGIKTARRTIYRKACEEGWAPAPTNDIQKAVWDKVHAMPAAPLKIKPETKKIAE